MLVKTKSSNCYTGHKTFLSVVTSFGSILTHGHSFFDLVTFLPSSSVTLSRYPDDECQSIDQPLSFADFDPVIMITRLYRQVLVAQWWS